MMNAEIIVLFLLFVSIAVGFAVWFNSEEEEWVRKYKKKYISSEKNILIKLQTSYMVVKVGEIIN